jgi:beta-glucanase (GH16 family)
VVDTTNPYHHFVNHDGHQPYEIDFEIWSSQANVNSEWDNNAFINYSIVDYMRNANAQIKPGEEKMFGKYKANRFNNRQINLPSEPLPSNFFDSFHNYELYWHPDRVEFLVDGKEVGVITKEMAAIPDKYMFLWVGSPLYQDGTYYEQSSIPFLKNPQQSIVDYIKID